MILSIKTTTSVIEEEKIEDEEVEEVLISI